MGKIHARAPLHLYDSFLFLGSSSNYRKKITKQTYPASKRIQIYIYIAIRHWARNNDWTSKERLEKNIA